MDTNRNKPDKPTENLLRELVVLNAQANPPHEWRDSLKLGISAFLAISLWFLLGTLALRHFQASLEFSRQLTATPPVDNDTASRIEKASTSVNDTAKTLYTLITPLATAITGYFFAASGSQSPITVTPRNQPSSPSDDPVDDPPR